MSTPVGDAFQRARDLHDLDSGIIDLAPNAWTLTTTKEGRCFTAAVKQYSIDKPRRRVFRVTNVDSATVSYVLSTLISGWNGNYQVDRVQIDLGTTGDQTRSFMDDSDWQVTIDPTTEAEVIYFPRNAPGEDWALWYLGPHTFVATSDAAYTSTVPTLHEEAISQLAASFCLEAAAVKASKFTETSGFQADGVNYSGIASRFQTAADRAKAEYERLIGKTQPDFSPSFVDLDMDSPYGPRVFHPDELF